MAGNPKLDTSSSSPDGAYGSQRSTYSNNSTLDRSGHTRDGHDARVLVLGAGGTGGGGGVYSSGSAIELPPLSQVLSLELLPIGEQRVGRHLELRRAINAVVGSTLDDPSLGGVQSKPLETCTPDELKRVRSSLGENGARARDRSRHFSEAITKLDKFRSSLQSRKRTRPESNTPFTPATFERSLSSISGVGERLSVGVQNMKGNSNVPPNHGNSVDTAVLKSADKNKRAVPNKRVRTSLADSRLEGRPNSLALQRPSALPDREREVSRPSSSFVSPVEEKEHPVPPLNEGWEKTKMKGRRSGTNQKPDAWLAAAATGSSEGDREHKWSGQQHRMSVDNRSRPSEGHGFRSGPVHGITSMHKAESFGQLNALPQRGASKSESDITLPGGDKAERASGADKDRTISKNGVKPPLRDESQTASPTGVTKSKAARAPRSNTSSGGPSSHLVRTSSFTDGRERHAPPAAKVQVLSIPNNRKRPAPSRSSSPPAQWVGQRPQKMARVARRVNLMPGATLSREETNATSEGVSIREAGAVSMGPRSAPGGAAGSGVARRVSVPNTQVQPKPKAERVTSSVGLSESDESEDDIDKIKEKGKKVGDWEQKPPPTVQKMGSVVLPAKKTRVISKEEGGDGIRRQGRSGRGSVAPRTTAVVNPVVEKADVVSANAKQPRSVRVGPDRHDRPGRPPTKKDLVDRKPMTRPRRPVGNGLTEISGESEDDHEELLHAVKAAVNASASACSNLFWKEMEPYFAFITPADVAFLHSLAKDLDERDPLLQIPLCGDQIGNLGMRCSTPSSSPNVDSGGKSMRLANGSVESDSFATKMFQNQNVKDRNEVCKGGRKGLSGGWFDKILPLSQRLLAALINEGDSDEGKRVGLEENCHKNLLEGLIDESSVHPSSTSESDYQDVDSDGAIARREVDRWSSGYTLYEGGGIVANGHTNYPTGSLLHGDGLGEGDDILADVEADSVSSAGKIVTGNGDDPFSGSSGTDKDDQRGTHRSYVSSGGMTAWEIQYQRMSVDDRILLELQSIGLLPDQVPDLAQREDDEISEELRKMQRELKDQVVSNKGQVNNLEKTVLARREVEES